LGKPHFGAVWAGRAFGQMPGSTWMYMINHPPTLCMLGRTMLDKSKDLKALFYYAIYLFNAFCIFKNLLLICQGRGGCHQPGLEVLWSAHVACLCSMLHHDIV
jgi:hypothetical protein